MYLHKGTVRQIIVHSLTRNQADLKTNVISDQSATDFAKLYAKDKIMLGPGNKEVALEAIEGYPKGLQVGGGIPQDNAQHWIEQGLRML
jgi:phosphoribosylformimino-5-aminoimidazole carboxamide ribotide isomerase